MNVYFPAIHWRLATIRIMTPGTSHFADALKLPVTRSDPQCRTANTIMKYQLLLWVSPHPPIKTSYTCPSVETPHNHLKNYPLNPAPVASLTTVATLHKHTTGRDTGVYKIKLGTTMKRPPVEMQFTRRSRHLPLQTKRLQSVDSPHQLPDQPSTTIQVMIGNSPNLQKLMETKTSTGDPCQIT